jgi:hypothetical protein
MPTPRKRPAVFTDCELELLFSEVRLFTRTFTLYWLAFRLGLSARQLSALDVGDVSADGREPGDAVRLRMARPYRSAPGGLIAIPGDTRPILRRYLKWRRECVHFRLPMRTYRDRSGKERCLVCREPIDFQACPLFSTGRRGRLAAKTMQNGFAIMRNQLGLDQALRFDSLRATHHALALGRKPRQPAEARQGGRERAANGSRKAAS